MRTSTRWLLAATALVAAGAGFVVSGLYDVSATDEHLPHTYALIRETMQRSIERRARGIAAPELGAPAQVQSGLAIFRVHCVQCHGAPGVAPEPFSLGLRPLPRPLVRSGMERSPSFLFWVIKHGIKMTGMPAWDFRMSDDDIWALVAFLRELPALTPAQYAERAAAARAPPPAQRDEASAPDAERGMRALEQYGCVGCHEAPGKRGPEARVGPPLEGIASRSIIAGRLPNTPENLARWIAAPRQVKPQTAMPDLGVTPRDARDIAAYLETLR